MIFASPRPGCAASSILHPDDSAESGRKERPLPASGRYCTHGTTPFRCNLNEIETANQLLAVSLGEREHAQWTDLDHCTRAPSSAEPSSLVAAKTGLTPIDAQKRVSETLTDARQTEKAARQTASHALLWIFLALLIGAFSASFSATIGGRQRDHVKVI